MGLEKNMITLVGILLIIIGAMMLNSDSDFGVFGIIGIAVGMILVIGGLMPLLSQIQ